MEKEIWKGVVGYEDFYQVSNLGRVCSLSRRKYTPNGEYLTGDIILKTNDIKKGLYFTIKCNGKQINTHLGKCIYETFNGKQNSKFKVIYKDGNYLNNNLSNLSIKKLKSEKAEIQKMFLDMIIENFNKNSRDDSIYSKEEIMKFLNLLNGLIK